MVNAEILVWNEVLNVDNGLNIKENRTRKSDTFDVLVCALSSTRPHSQFDVDERVGIRTSRRCVEKSRSTGPVRMKSFVLWL